MEIATLDGGKPQDIHRRLKEEGKLAKAPRFYCVVCDNKEWQTLPSQSLNASSAGTVTENQIPYSVRGP